MLKGYCLHKSRVRKLLWNIFGSWLKLVIGISFEEAFDLLFVFQGGSSVGQVFSLSGGLGSPPYDVR